MGSPWGCKCYPKVGMGGVGLPWGCKCYPKVGVGLPWDFSSGLGIDDVPQ